ncbi:hypothetical protein GCM10008985_34340 [Halococcus dombrowskii]|uniref:Uncharacterized protein n=1 Tax=Halococcus dombrowskii TaxID=179637 RepID=A0AAV3SM23_HALDO
MGIVGEEALLFGVLPCSEHLGIIEASIRAIGWALVGVSQKVRERVVGGFVLVVVRDVVLVDDDEIRLALAVIAQGIRILIVDIETTRIANIEVE